MRVLLDFKEMFFFFILILCQGSSEAIMYHIKSAKDATTNVADISMLYIYVPCIYVQEYP